MIKLLRVDFRLIHGQTGVVWTSTIGVDCILVSSDSVLSDLLRLTTLKLCKPNNIKLVIKGIEDSIQAINSGVTDKYKMMILTENVTDAKKIAEGCKIQNINLGGVKPRDNAKKLGNAVYCTDEEIQSIRDLISKGYNVYVQQLPSDPEIPAQSII